MPLGDRLIKRQAQYLKQFGIFVNAKRDDEFYKLKRDCAKEFRKLNKMITQYSPFDEFSNRKNDKDHKLSDEQITVFLEQYRKTIDKLDALTLANHKKRANTNKKKKKEQYGKNIELYDQLSKTLSKDYNAFLNTKERNERYDLHELFETSRVSSDYTVIKVSDDINKGSVNSRIPVTLKTPDNQEITGYFTVDNKTPGKDYVKDKVAETKKKYNGSADFISADTLLQIFRSICSRAEARDKKQASNALYARNLLLWEKENLLMKGYEDKRRILREAAGMDIAKYMTTPKKTNMFIDLLSTTAAAGNQMNISNGAGIRSGANVNRRNAAISRMAQLLGFPDLVAQSFNVKLDIGGKKLKGTFMKEVKGVDVSKLTEDSDVFNITLGGLDELNLKKQLANLQVLDYLCGNPDRHGGNMLYNITKNEDGTYTLKVVCGIDNDTSFGSMPWNSMRDGMSGVSLENMNVITAEMARAINRIDTAGLKSMFYGYELSSAELSWMEKRVKDLKNKVKEDALDFQKGFRKGGLIPTKIKTVEDEELNELSISEDLAPTADGERNIFGIVIKALNAKSASNSLGPDLATRYSKVSHDISFGGVPAVNVLIKRLNDDNRIGRSSVGYERMLESMKDLKKALESYSGPDFEEGGGRILAHGNNIMLLKEKLRETLINVNEYIAYKDNKTRGEEWRSIQGEHKASRTERRYHDAMACREFLNKQLDKYEKLDDALYNLNSFRANKSGIDMDIRRNETEYQNSEEYKRKKKIRRSNLYNNHVSRTIYEIDEAFDMYSAYDLRDKGVKGNEFNDRLKLQIYQRIGFGIMGIHEVKRPVLRKMISEKHEVELNMTDDELLKYAVAINIVFRKQEIDNAEEMYPIDYEHKNALRDVITTPVMQAVDQLVSSKEFNDFYRQNEELIKAGIDDHEPCVSLPSGEHATKLYDQFRKVYIKHNPEKMTENEKKAISKAADKSGRASQRSSMHP